MFGCLPSFLKKPIFDPRIPLKLISDTNARDSARRMSFEASTSFAENSSDDSSNTEQTLSEY